MKLYDCFLEWEHDSQTYPVVMMREVALGQVFEPYVLYSEAQERIEALEWLVEAQDLRIHRIINAGEWANNNAGPSVREAWRRRNDSNYELRDTFRAARAAAGV